MTPAVGFRRENFAVGWRKYGAMPYLRRRIVYADESWVEYRREGERWFTKFLPRARVITSSVVC
jgi:hypothetical protein